MYQSWKNNHINQTVIILFPLIKNKFSNFVFIFYWHQQFIKCYMHVFFSSRWVNIQITTFEFIYQKVIYCISKMFDRYPWLFFQYLLIMIVNNFEIRTIVINISPNILNFVKISINTLPLTRSEISEQNTSALANTLKNKSSIMFPKTYIVSQARESFNIKNII